MEITFVEAIVIATDTCLQVLLHLQTTMNDQGTARLDQFCIMAETLQISLFGAVDIEVVRISRGNDTHPRMEPMEGTVELIGLDDHVVGVREDIVGAVVLRDTAKEGITVQLALVHDMGTHCRCGGLSMGSCHTESLVGLCQRA